MSSRAARALVAVALAAAALVPPAVQAQEFDFQRDCARWIEQHGYSSDYRPPRPVPIDTVVRVWRPSLPL